jgi:uncharacterized RDD family membrane protein YckC
VGQDAASERHHCRNTNVASNARTIMTTDKKRITDIFREKVVTRKERNQYGEMETVERVFKMKRPVDNLSMSKRFINLLVDSLVISLIQYPIGYLNMLNPSWTFILLAVLIYFLYYILFEFYLQRTIGKFITGSIVVNEYGDRPDFKMICLRTVIRIIPFEFISYFGQDENRWWHDRWTRTYVITKEELSLVTRILAGEKPKRTDQGKWDEWHSWQQNV